jgi:hypothetical protein
MENKLKHRIISTTAVSFTVERSNCNPVTYYIIHFFKKGDKYIYIYDTIGLSQKEYNISVFDDAGCY